MQLCRLRAFLSLRVTGDPDGDQKGRAVEQRLHPEAPAKLLDAGNTDGEDHDADDGAPDIDPSGFDGGRAEEGADEGRQQEFKTDRGLTDSEL